MIILKNIQLSLLSGSSLFTQLNYHFDAQMRHVINGDNGVGKSTLLGVIAGMRMLTGGSVFYGDRDISHLPVHERSRLFLGMLFQRPLDGCVATLTVAQNLQLASLRNKPLKLAVGLESEVLRKALVYAEALELPLHSLLDRYMGNLSGGQQQLIVFIMVMLGSPSLLLLDEPTAALSPRAVNLFGDVLCRAQEQERCTIICVTHDKVFAEHIATRTHELSSGGVLRVVNSIH